MPLKLGDRLLGRSREVKKRDPRLKVCQLYRYYSLVEEILEHLCPEINDPADRIQKNSNPSAPLLIRPWPAVDGRLREIQTTYYEALTRKFDLDIWMEDCLR